MLDSREFVRFGFVKLDFMGLDFAELESVIFGCVGLWDFRLESNAPPPIRNNQFL